MYIQRGPTTQGDGSLIKVRLLPIRPAVPVDLVNARMNRCCELIDEYLRARSSRRDRNAALNARLEISLFVPPGAYCLGGDTSKEMYAVFGVHETGKLSGREEAFEVPHTRIHEKGEFGGGWKRSPLIGTEGFIVTACTDHYRGERFIRVGELVHS